MVRNVFQIFKFSKFSVVMPPEPPKGMRLRRSQLLPRHVKSLRTALKEHTHYTAQDISTTKQNGLFLCLCLMLIPSDDSIREMSVLFLFHMVSYTDKLLLICFCLF